MLVLLLLAAGTTAATFELCEPPSPAEEYRPPDGSASTFEEDPDVALSLLQKRGRRSEAAQSQNVGEVTSVRTSMAGAVAAVDMSRSRYTAALAVLHGAALGAEHTPLGSSAGIPNLFTARVVFEATLPGPGRDEYFNLTSFWVRDGAQKRERYDTLAFTRALSSSPWLSMDKYESTAQIGSVCWEYGREEWGTGTKTCAQYESEDRVFQPGVSTSIRRWVPHALVQKLGNSGAHHSIWPAHTLTFLGSEPMMLIGGQSMDCEKYGWQGEFGGSHTVWVSKSHGLVVREEQQDEGGPTNNYPGHAVVELTYDYVIEGYLMRMDPLNVQAFAKPEGCHSWAQTPVIAKP
mmetsp:Transcript_136759/g.381179  ORF Transcript_136759/g.381179 Transcript_136759/m.381179 type:complete len:348 (-) Transcript_136759:101-1144(-)